MLAKLRAVAVQARGRTRTAPKAILKVAVARMRAIALPRRALRTGALAVLGAVLLLGLAFFAFRNTVLRSVLDSRLHSYERHNAGVFAGIGLAKFNGLARIDLENIRLRSPGGDFTAALKKCSLRVSFLKMLTGRLHVQRLELNGLELDLRPQAAPGPSPNRPGGTSGAAPDYGARAERLLDFFFTRSPDSLEIEHLTIHSTFGNIRQAVYVPRLALRGAAFETKLEVFDQGKKWSGLLAGSIDRGKRRLEMRLLPQRGNGPASLPFIERQWGLKVDFTSLAVGLRSRGSRGGALRLDGSLSVMGLKLNHPRIAGEDVHFQNAAVDYVLRIGPDFIELAQPTRAMFNKLSFSPYLKFMATAAGPQLTLKIEKSDFRANDFFSSLPAGLFTSLAGLQAGGRLSWHLDFFIDFSRPQALRLETGLEKHGFRIERFGCVDFREVNAPFLYTAYEKDLAQRAFVVGPENPDFRSLEQIPPCLKNAVMISEDGAFFSHRGFLLEPFRESIAANLKERRFVRGASTISMQLVKNLYLKRQKTIARKLEEMIITWLIEENRLVGKERMFEIYLNIIEWGPGVYGAQEAARFYFAKDVADLDLAEAIFMASIIPRPGKFMTCFDSDKQLRPWLQAYYADVSAKMLQRGWIGQQDFDTLVAAVRLQGPARLLLKSATANPLEPPDPESLGPANEDESR